MAGLWLGLAAWSAAVPPAYEVVFFDLPEALEPSPIPAPTGDLAALPGYPNDPDQLTLAGAVYEPDPMVHGPGPYPAIVILHGSGGCWSDNDISKGVKNQFKDWAEPLASRGYVLLVVDSFKARGIAGGFAGKRPHHDPALDDALCSPNYERPKDVVAALMYLGGRTDVDPERIGLMGFSHGAQTGLNVLMDLSIVKSPYTVDWKNAMNVTEPLVVPDPVMIPAGVPLPKVFACYYPGCGHYGYHGQASSIAFNRYMPDRRVPTVMFHGALDYLLDVDDPDADPMTGNLYPIKFVESSQLQANVLGIENPFVAHHIFEQADHSFDGHTIEDEVDWNTVDEDADEKAKRLARDETLKWFAFRLKPPVIGIETDPMDVDQLQVCWHGEGGIEYVVRSASDLQGWGDESSTVIGDDDELVYPFDPALAEREFFRLLYSPVPAPVGLPENSGFFRPYADFSY